MTTQTKSILLFLGGMTLGGGAGVLATRGYFKKKYEEIADAEIQEMDDYFHKKNQELIKLFEDKSKEGQGLFSVVHEAAVKVKEEYSDISRNEVMAQAKEKLTRNYEQTTNYANMYRSKTPGYDDLTEEEYEALENALEDTSEEAVARAAHEDHQANKDRPPKIISEDALGELPGYIDQKTLFFYRLDDTVTDEEDEIVDDPEYLLGDCLDKYNFRESDEKTIFVRNFALDTVYEVQKVEAAFGEDES